MEKNSFALISKIDLFKFQAILFNCGHNNIHLKNWIFEVSNDGEKWEEIDRHSDDSTLNGCSFKSRFNINNPQEKFL